jgi:uncharacterized protein YqfB (UPF0267 family)
VTKSASPFRPGDVIKVEHASHDWHYVVLDMSDTSSIELELIWSTYSEVITGRHSYVELDTIMLFGFEVL